MPPVTITPLLSPRPSSASFTGPPPHHVGNPPTSFTNPWPSFHGTQNLLSVLQTRFFAHDRHFVPVPADRAELVPVQRPDWGAGKTGLKATWIGHASFVVETRDLVGKGEAEEGGGGGRGVRVLFDPVWSERMSPVSWAGPKRFSPVPCAIDECPEVDVVCISHNHYDHLDADTIAAVHRRGGGRVRFLCPLGIKRWFLSMGIREEEVAELDWWDGVLVDVEGVGSVRLVCTPSQHFSGRGVWDHGVALWCSWVLEETTVARDGTGEGRQISAPRKLFFAGDTGYRTITSSDDPAAESSLPHCPAFAEIGNTYGPFDLALLPIGCYSPRTFMSGVHCAPEDSIYIHKDIRSKKSIGMHYGTLRGALSAQYEDVREPPGRWKEACERAGLVWGEEIGLCDIGETVVV